MAKYVYYRNTKDRCDHEYEAQVMEKMGEDSELIDWEEFDQNVEWQHVASTLGYDEDLSLKDDWHVSYSKSFYGGLPCYVLGHSECDFIFLRQEDAKMLHEFHSQDMTSLEWKRVTSFGTMHDIHYTKFRSGS